MLGDSEPPFARFVQYKFVYTCYAQILQVAKQLVVVSNRETIRSPHNERTELLCSSVLSLWGE